MGKSSPKITTYSYKMSITFGICHGLVDRIHKIFIKEKEAIHDPCHGEVLLIDKPNLFGGVKKEGGAIGSVYFQNGSYTQKLHADIAAKLDGTPDTLPGYRGVATATFAEGGSSYGSVGPGFYWSENQPNIPPPWFMVERIGRPTVMKGLARILRSGGAATLAEVSELTETVGPLHATGDTDDDSFVIDWARQRAYLTVYDREIAVFDLATLSHVVTYSFPSFQGPLFIRTVDQETGYLGGRWWGLADEVEDWVIDPSTGTIITYHYPRDVDDPVDPSTELSNASWAVFGDGIAKKVVTPKSTSTRYRIMSFPGLTWVADIDGPDVSGSTWRNTSPVRGAENEAWGAWYSTTETQIVRFSTAHPAGGAAVKTFLPTDIDASATAFAWTTDAHLTYLPDDSLLLALTLDSPGGTKRYLVKWGTNTDKIAWKVDLTNEITGFHYDSRIDQFPNLTAGYTLMIPVQHSVIEDAACLLDLNTGEHKILASGYAEEHFGWDEDSGCAYNFSGMDAEPETEIALRRWCVNPCSAVYDMNPAHIIAECLTDPVWGLGLPDTALNADNFRSVAQTLYNEGFGLSMIWTEKETIEKFVQEVIDHIEATLYINPANGLFEIKLIRDDYDESTLRTINPSNARLTKFSRRQPTETTNEIVLQWTNPDTEKLESITQQDLGAVVAAGRVNSDNRNYYAVHKRDLAAKLLARDLRSAAAPLALGEAEVDRTFWDIIPGEPVKLVWPEYGITEDDPVLMRVMGVNYGKPGASAIKLKLSEDVFSLTGQALEAPPESEHDATPAAPTAADDTRLLTLPYFLAYNLVNPSATAAAEYPEVFVGALVAESDERAFEADLHGEVIGAAGNSSFEYLDTLALVAQGTLQADLPWEAQTEVSDWGSLTKGTGPVVGGLVLIAADGDTDETAELCLVAGKAGDVWTLHRGVLDTVPRAWTAGTKVWFLAPSEDIADDNIRAAADTLDYKVLPRTDGGTLAEADAALLQITTSERPWLPLRPANVTIGGVQFDDVYYTTKPATVDITWADRNRETENAQVLSWTDAGITPETGQTVEVEVWNEDASTLLHTFTGLTGGSANLDETFFNQTQKTTVRVYAERDGLRSLQYYEALVDTRGGIGYGEDYGNDYGGTAV